jgi:predicted nucleic acid-binding protein
LLNLLFKDTLRTRILEESEIVRLPDELLTGIHDDDRYLLELANTVKESVIITTDSRLIEALAEKKIARSIHLLNYIK